MYDVIMVLPKDTKEIEKKLAKALAKIANNRLNNDEKIELLSRLQNK